MPKKTDKPAGPMSADVFLSRHGVRYDGIDLPGTPAQMMAALITLNQAREIDADGALVDITYQTADFTPSPISGNTFSSKNVTKQQTAMNHYFDMLRTGNLDKVHAAVDALNQVRQVMGGSEFIPPSDFEILAHSQNEVGAVARQLVSDRATTEEEGTDFWWDQEDAFNDINDYASSQ